MNMENKSKLKSILRIPATIRLFFMITILAIVVSGLVNVVMYVKMMEKEDELTRKIWIMDKTGAVNLANKTPQTMQTRIYEYEHHIKWFYRLAYAFDENNFKDNMERLMWLADDCGRELVNQYFQQDLYNELVSKNIMTYVVIERVEINREEFPISGTIYGIQISERDEYVKRRRMDVQFTIKDSNRSRKNPHGAKITKWEVVNNEIIKEK